MNSGTALGEEQAGGVKGKGCGFWGLTFGEATPSCLLWCQSVEMYSQQKWPQEPAAGEPLWAPALSHAQEIMYFHQHKWMLPAQMDVLCQRPTFVGSEQLPKGYILTNA